MSHEQHDEARSLGELVVGTPPVAMVMTMVDGVHTSRPVTVAHVFERRLSFLVDRRSGWVDAIARRAAVVHVTLANDSHTSYLSLGGTATITTDRASTRALWTSPAGAWFDGPDDPNLAVLQFEVSDGRYWDGPDGLVGRGLAMLRAAVTGSSKGTGTNGAVDLGSDEMHR